MLARRHTLGGTERSIAIVLIAAFSIGHYLILSARSLLAPDFDLGGTALLRLVTCAAGGAVCFGIYLILAQIRHWPIAARIGIAAVVSGPAALLYQIVNDLVFWQFNAHPFSGVETYDFISSALYFMWFILAWAASFLAASYSLEIGERERRLAEANAQANQAQLRSLRYQIAPHFLFNTLSSIASLIADRKNDVAETMVLDLADFFRATLATDPLEDSTLADEFALQRTYLDVESKRFPDRLAVEIDLPASLKGALVPSLLLQPLVENAIKHSVAPTTARTLLRIAASDTDGQLNIVVANEPCVVGGGKRGVGVGLENVRKRLETRFGSEAAVEAGPCGATYRVHLKLPLAFRG